MKEPFPDTESTCAAVRQALFKRVLEIGERNRGLSADQMLDELERGERGAGSDKTRG